MQGFDNAKLEKVLIISTGTPIKIDYEIKKQLRFNKIEH